LRIDDISFYKAILRLILALFSIFLTWPANVASQSSPSVQIAKEYQIKGAFLCKFVKFIDWTERPKIEGPTAEPTEMCILGQDPFGDALDQLVALNREQNNPIHLRRLVDAQSYAGCRVLFISDSERPRVAAIIRESLGRPILTVSDIHDFVQLGGAIELGVEAQHVEFYVNQAVAQQNGLQISSRLLQLAARVIK
jgi:hypothetical protein